MIETPLETRTRKAPILGGGKRMNRDTRREQRRTDAHRRDLLHSVRTDAEQLAVLQDRGHGNCAEARALADHIIGDNS